MKKITLLSTLCFLLLTLVVNAQTPPNAFNYSAVARNAAGQPIATTTIGVQITILKTSPTGVSQYSENHFVNTDAFGLFNLVIGAGAVQSGSMATIDWSIDNYYLKVGMDAAGGTNFLTMGTTQLLSVPYAMYAKSAGSVSSNPNTVQTLFHIRGTGYQGTANMDPLLLNSTIDTLIDLGSNYNASTNTYSCPINGTYEFIIDIQYCGNYEIRVNGGPQYLLPDGVFNYSGAQGGNGPHRFILNLQQGDIVSFYGEGWYDLSPPYAVYNGSITGWKW